MDEYLRRNGDHKRQWLDFGSVIGGVLVAGQDLGYQAIGLEISEVCLEFGHKHMLDISFSHWTE